MWAYLERLWHRLASPRHFYEIAGLWLPWLAAAAFALLAVGMVWGLLFAPADYQQGHSFRIIYVHVPAASLALSGYFAMAVAGVVVLVWRMKMAEIVLRAIAVPGAVMCAIALFSGAVWGKPTWGTYWFWDARITSMLILLFLYIGVIALGSAIVSPVLSARQIFRGVVEHAAPAGHAEAHRRNTHGNGNAATAVAQHRGLLCVFCRGRDPAGAPRHHRARGRCALGA
jgi:heme exporter protein C